MYDSVRWRMRSMQISCGASNSLLFSLSIRGYMDFIGSQSTLHFSPPPRLHGGRDNYVAFNNNYNHSAA
jgi:hypothetical protein